MEGDRTIRIDGAFRGNFRDKRKHRVDGISSYRWESRLLFFEFFRTWCNIVSRSDTEMLSYKGEKSSKQESHSFIYINFM